MNHTKQREYFLLIELCVIRRLLLVPVLVLCPRLLDFDYDDENDLVASARVIGGFNLDKAVKSL